MSYSVVVYHIKALQIHDICECNVRKLNGNIISFLEIHLFFSIYLKILLSFMYETLLYAKYKKRFHPNFSILFLNICCPLVDMSCYFIKTRKAKHTCSKKNPVPQAPLSCMSLILLRGTLQLKLRF